MMLSKILRWLKPRQSQSEPVVVRCFSIQPQRGGHKVHVTLSDDTLRTVGIPFRTAVSALMWGKDAVGREFEEPSR